MNLRLTSWMLLVVACHWPLAALAQLQLLPDVQPQQVFAGTARTISVVWRNPGDKTAEADIRARIIQTSSATAIPLVEVPWKKLEVLPQQTVLETARLDFPAVKAETKFLILWLESSNSVVGKTEVFVYPTNLLAELKPLAGDKAIGVFDPQNQLKPLLKNLKMDFTDLENSGLENFSGPLAIISPFQSKAQTPGGLTGRILTLAKNGAAVVWLQPAPEKPENFPPSFYFVSVNTNSVVVVQPELVSDLPESPQSQRNLVYLCRLVLNPPPPALPGLSPP